MTFIIEFVLLVMVNLFQFENDRPYLNKSEKIIFLVSYEPIISYLIVTVLDSTILCIKIIFLLTLSSRILIPAYEYVLMFLENFFFIPLYLEKTKIF